MGAIDAYLRQEDPERAAEPMYQLESPADTYRLLQEYIAMIEKAHGAVRRVVPRPLFPSPR